ncbi:hypothetical protein JW824_09715 [bacterium]|nr:hypothetical protein [bacterium]RQV94366.1 MAG: hypothetical protein EH221_07915 [bacterium]
MDKQNLKNDTHLVDGFSLIEKILMRMGFYGFIFIGAYGIYSATLLWGLLYTGFVLFGLGFVFLYCLCAHCPYPYEYSDCLFLPAGLIKKLYKSRSEQMHILDKVGFLMVMGGLVIIPQYWLLKRDMLLILFWIFCLPTLARLLFYLCKRCRHFNCPLNRVVQENPK